MPVSTRAPISMPLSATTGSDSGPPPAGRHPVVQRAFEDFERAHKWESSARKNFLHDIKFAHADYANGYQWPNDIRRQRDIDERPCLTINKVKQHNLMIINDAKKNKPGIKIRGAGSGSTADSAKMLTALMRHIEYRSHASAAYDIATAFQVHGGVGWLRAKTDYVAEDSFDQEILIESIDDPLMVLSDPDAKLPGKLDKNFLFIFDDVHRDDLERKYPEAARYATQSVLNDSDWARTDYVRIAEYYVREQEEDRIYAFRTSDTQETRVLRRSTIELGSKEGAQAIIDNLEGDEAVRKRDTTRTVVKWYYIVGEHIIDESEWPGDFIPVVEVVGEETVIDGIMDKRGHTRAMIDPQRMYNYWASLAVEYGGLQTLTPWIAPVEAIEGYEGYWNTANRIRHSVLPYNGVDDAGNKIEAPKRVEPPVSLPVAIAGMQQAMQEIMMVSGQYADQMGDKSNERSGKAIMERQRQSDTSTYHFVDNLAIAIRALGQIILNAFPRVYDTQRLIQINAEDGQAFELMIDPKAEQAYQQRVAYAGKVAEHVLNPNVGLYEVHADIGPSWGTKREEAVNALTLILTQAPQLTNLIGDLLVKACDFDLADEAAARLRRMVPPAALGEGPSMPEQQLQQRVQQLEALLARGMEELAKEKLKIKSQDARRDTDVFNAITQRLKIFLDAKSAAAQQQIDMAELHHVIDESLREAGEQSLEPVQRAEEAGLAETTPGPQALGSGAAPMMPPMQGARLGPDGRYYMRDFGASRQYRAI
jgi:hypothetical protein